MVLKACIILHLSSGTVCYEYPSRNYSVPINVSCTFPENLCFKYDNTTANGEQVYPLINADNLMIIKCTVVKGICVIVVSKLKYNGHKIAKNCYFRSAVPCSSETGKTYFILTRIH